MTRATLLIACAIVSAVRADTGDERLLEQAKRDAHSYAALVEKQAAREAEREEKQRRALMAPWRLEELKAAEAAEAAEAAGPELQAVLVEDGSGRFVPRAWAMGARPAPGAAAAPRAAVPVSVAGASAPPDISRGQAPAVAGTYMGGQYTAPSGAYQLPTTPSVAQPQSSYAQPIMPQSR